MNTLTTFLLASVILCHSAAARFVQVFTYEELIEMSDLVVIAEHESTNETDKSDPRQNGAGRVTTMKVLASLKGEPLADTVTIHHFFYQKSPWAPRCVLFPPPQASSIFVQASTPTVQRSGQSIKPTRHYLVFLKKQADGTYIPATPQFDSELSFIPLGGGDLNYLWGSTEDSESYGEEEQRAPIRKLVETSYP